MVISFSMDRIKNMDQLYTWTVFHSEELGCDGKEEHYHGDDYCKQIIADALKMMNWGEQEYLGSHERIANEVFIIKSSTGTNYRVDFAINTYERKAARLECTITAKETQDYDQKLEELKITLKNKLVPDWEVCTWLVDMQSAQLCKEAYERAFIVENSLRAFASKVLIHFLGVDWINKAGLEKEAESVSNLKQKFIQRVPEFDDINADFLSMTLETLVGVMFKGVTYKNEITINKSQYKEIWEKAAKNVSGNGIAEYIKSKRTVEKRIWDDLFIPFIEDPDGFQKAAHDFIEDRNHVAHSKVLSWSAYQIILKDFEKMDSLILMADTKFDREETSDEVLDTWEAMHEEEADEREYYRERIASESGIDILDESEIKDWFDEVIHELFNDVYQRYHLDACYEISDSSPQDKSVCFSIICPAVEDGSARVDISAEYAIDDELGEDSYCTVVCKDGTAKEICRAEIRFHNGNGYEGEEGIMEASEDTEYDTTELVGFRDELFKYIDEDLNPYVAELDALVYKNKGDNSWTADFACSQCGKFGVSINEDFLPIGRCCYCGWENELETCKRCGELANVDDMENGFCPSCSSYVDKQ